MQIILNGEPHDLNPETSVADLVAELDLTHKRVAIEVNMEIVPRSTFQDHLLHEGDKIEIVNAIGGG